MTVAAHVCNPCASVVMWVGLAAKRIMEAYGLASLAYATMNCLSKVEGEDRHQGYSLTHTCAL